MNIKTKLLWQTFFTTAMGIAAIAIVNVASVNFISDQIGKESLAAFVV